MNNIVVQKFDLTIEGPGIFVVKSADFLVFPTLFEGLGIPLLEAMQFGLPIVASKVTCLPEVAEDAALYFDPLSVDSIAEAILKAWQNPELLEEYRTRGRV